MYQILLIIQAIISIGLLICIILQPQGTGLGNAWAGGGETYHTRRGIEKVIFGLTIVLAVLFALNGLLLLIMQ